MALVSYLDYVQWPQGGMLNYVLNILPALEMHYEIELWGCSKDTSSKRQVEINGKYYEVNVFGNAKTKHKIVPNYICSLWQMWCKASAIDRRGYDVIYLHGAQLCWIYSLKAKPRKAYIVNHQLGLSAPKRLVKLLQEWAARKADFNLVTSDLQSIEDWAIICKRPVDCFAQATC